MFQPSKTFHLSSLRNLELNKKEDFKDAKKLSMKDNTSRTLNNSMERNFITPIRAMNDFFLKSSDLDMLRKTRRRSPYENEPPITVYWLKDVEAKALEVWGSQEALIRERIKKAEEVKRYQQYIFGVKQVLKDFRKEKEEWSPQGGLMQESGKVVLTAIGINGVNFLFKLGAWLHTGSHSMFSECLHSLADTVNQLIIAYGIHISSKQPNNDHPYGYYNMRYVTSLISGVGIFFAGAGLSVYHGITGFYNPDPIGSFYWAFYILGGSLLSESATLMVAVNSIRKGALKQDMSFWEYVKRGQDPSVNVVLLEDLAAVLGVGVAGSCMALASYFNSPIPDAIGSLLVGGLLGAVASFIIYTNSGALVGRSIPLVSIQQINSELERDLMIRAVHDVKGIDMGSGLVRYKAEVDFDGKELTRSYLEKQDFETLLEEIQKIKQYDEMETFLLKHGENIVDLLGAEIDRIERDLRRRHPEVRHCDLELL